MPDSPSFPPACIGCVSYSQPLAAPSAALPDPECLRVEATVMDVVSGVLSQTLARSMRDGKCGYVARFFEALPVSVAVVSKNVVASSLNKQGDTNV